MSSEEEGSELEVVEDENMDISEISEASNKAPIVKLVNDPA